MKQLFSLFSRIMLGLLLWSLASSVYGQAPDWQQAVAVAGRLEDARVADMVVDEAGNVYVVGTYSSALHLSSTVQLPPVGGLGATDGFIAKWSSAAKDFVWAQAMGGSNTDYTSAVVVQGNDVYVAGSFTSATAQFGTITLTNARRNTADLFIAKLRDLETSAGFSWAIRAGNTGNEEVAKLALSKSGLYVAGTFEGQVTFGSTVLASIGYADGFVAKVTDSGSAASLVWGQAVSSTGSDWINGLVAQNNSVYLAGSVLGPTASFGALTLTTSSDKDDDMFVAKLTDVGNSSNFAWAQLAGGALFDAATALAVNGENIYIGGFFSSPTCVFGNISLAGSAQAGTDAFVAKLIDNASSSSFVWALPVRGPGYEQPMALASRGEIVYLSGYFDGDTATFGNSTLTSRGSNDIFLTRLTDAGAAGRFDWVQQAGGTQTDYNAALAVVGTRVYVGGSLTPPARFGSHLLDGPTNTNVPLAGYWALLNDTYQPLAAALAVPVTGLELYPNPAHTVVAVELPASVRSVPTMLTLHNAIGQVVHTLLVAPATTNATLPLAGLAPGLYQLRAQAGGWHATQTLLVE